MYTKIVRVVAVCLLSGGVAACGAGSRTDAPTPDATVRPGPTRAPASATPAAAPSTAVAIDGPPASLTINAAVGSFDTTTRAITLASRFGQVERVVLAGETILRDAQGAPTTVDSIEPGVIIQVWGDMGQDGAMLAQQVQVMGRR